MGLFRGYGTTVLREVPFSLIQFPLWEILKKTWQERSGAGAPPSAWQSSLCGAAAGGFAAAVTTPLDVAKTRIMLAPAGSEEARGTILSVLRGVVAERGVRGAFAGVAPRVTWISIGGSVFFGVYELAKSFLTRMENSKEDR